MGRAQKVEQDLSCRVVDSYERTRRAQFSYRRGEVAQYAALFLALGSPALLTPLVITIGEPGLFLVAAVCSLFLLRGGWLLHLMMSARPAVSLTEDCLIVGRKEIKWTNVKGARLTGSSRGSPALVITYEGAESSPGRRLKTRTLWVAIGLIENGDALLRCLRIKVPSQVA
jgi:hypothetical protein